MGQIRGENSTQEKSFRFHDVFSDSLYSRDSIDEIVNIVGKNKEGASSFYSVDDSDRKIADYFKHPNGGWIRLGETEHAIYHDGHVIGRTQDLRQWKAIETLLKDDSGASYDDSDLYIDNGRYYASQNEKHPLFLERDGGVFTTSRSDQETIYLMVKTGVTDRATAEASTATAETSTATADTSTATAEASTATQTPLHPDGLPLQINNSAKFIIADGYVLNRRAEKEEWVSIDKYQLDIQEKDYLSRGDKFISPEDDSVMFERIGSIYTTESSDPRVIGTMLSRVKAERAIEKIASIPENDVGSANEKGLNKEDVIIPWSIRKNYTQVDEHFYDKKSDRIMFTDKGQKIATSTSDMQVVRDMVDLAKAKQWDSLKLNGSKEFRQKVWLQAESQGIRTYGYKPNELDKARLKELTEERSINTITPIQPDNVGKNMAFRAVNSKTEATEHREVLGKVSEHLEELKKQPQFNGKSEAFLKDAAYLRSVLIQDIGDQPSEKIAAKLTSFDEKMAKMDSIDIQDSSEREQKEKVAKPKGKTLDIGMSI